MVEGGREDPITKRNLNLGLPGPAEYDSLSQPRRELLLVDLVSSNGQHYPFGVVDIWWERYLVNGLGVREALCLAPIAAWIVR